MTWPELERRHIEYPETGVVYPESDGQPMAETELHRRLMVYLIEAGCRHFEKQTDGYVTGDLLLYYVEGDNTKSVAPDFFFVRGVPRGLRRTYRTWEEGKGPEVVIEVTSRWTFRNDVGRKKELYEKLEVEEYFLFDPTEDRLKPPLRGFRLEGGVFRPMEEPRAAGENFMLTSAIMGLEIHCRREFVRFKDSRTGEFLPSAVELEARAETERRRAETERRRAETERHRADAAEAELARLREELRRLQDKD